MTLRVLELNDAGLRLSDESGVLLSSPGYALVLPRVAEGKARAASSSASAHGARAGSIRCNASISSGTNSVSTPSRALLATSVTTRILPSHTCRIWQLPPSWQAMSCWQSRAVFRGSSLAFCLAC